MNIGKGKIIFIFKFSFYVMIEVSLYVGLITLCILQSLIIILLPKNKWQLDFWPQPFKALIWFLKENDKI